MDDVSLHVPPFQPSWKGAACIASGLSPQAFRSPGVVCFSTVVRCDQALHRVYIGYTVCGQKHMHRFEVALAIGTFVYHFRLALNGCYTYPKGQGFLSIYMWGQHLAILLWYIYRSYSPVNSRFSCEGCLSYKTHNP